MKVKEIIEQGYDKIMCVYTKCNPKCNESLESGNWRSLWGIIKSETEFEIRLFEVSRDNYVSDRCMDLKRTIKISPDTEMIPMGGKRIPVE